MAALDKINRSPLYEQVANLITTSIVDGKYKVGDQLPTENALAENYGVSRTVIREAMKALKEKGIVETKVAKGTFITSNYEKSIGDSIEMMVHQLPEVSLWNILEIRKSFEPEIAAIATERAEKSDLAKLEQNVKEMEICVEDSKSDNERYLKFAITDQHFHQLTVETTKNSLMVSILTPLFAQIHPQLLSHIVMKPGALIDSLHGHIRILNAIKQGNADLAREEMRKHLLSVERDFESLQNKKE